MSAVHAFVANPWGKPICDAKIDVDGRVRTCNEPLTAAVHGERPHPDPSVDSIVADAADAYLVAHLELVQVGISPERPAAAGRLADAWLDLNQAIAVRREAAGKKGTTPA